MAYDLRVFIFFLQSIFQINILHFHGYKWDAKLQPLIPGQINLIKLNWHIFWIKNCSIRFNVYIIKLVRSKLIKLVSKKWAHFDLVGVIQPSCTFFAVWRFFEFIRVICLKLSFYYLSFSFLKGKYSCDQRCI